MNRVTEERWLSLEEIATYLGIKMGHGLQMDQSEKDTGPEGWKFVEIQAK
jgi:hypothetical protein